MKNFFALALLIVGTFAQAQIADTNAATCGRSFFSFDYPMDGVIDTEATALTPSGMIVGIYFTPDRNVHGFTLIDGRFQSIDAPGATSTYAAWVNNHGDIVGGCDCNGISSAYVLRNGQFSTFTNPGSTNITAWGITNSDDVLGALYDDDFLAAHGYLYHRGEFTPIDFPGAKATWPVMAINANAIVGTYYIADNMYHGFLRLKGKFSTIDVPNSIFTWITGINQAGHIVGFYNLTDGSQHGFVLKDGKYISVDVPGAIGTEANGIDLQDNVVGRYYTDDGHTHGYFMPHVH
jgi:probable HAF family extracellular repeat protein